MAYQPLARKYRPARFGELVGQEAVAQALANAIALGREPHAVLFTGVRGVGKTTTARLYAKALNCRRPQPIVAGGAAVEPCNECDSCQAVSRGVHEDIQEIDGASHNGVDHVRALQETVDYRPQRSRFRVFIIDEVHMLSQAAFNALLKTLEEPPSHVVFILATTEVHKVPETILSRCQAFYLKKLPTPLIQQRLAAILAQEGIAAEERALALIAREGHGSLRDSLTLLDQALALGDGAVTVAALGPLLTHVSSTLYIDLLAALVARDVGRVLALTEQLDQSGAEFPSSVEILARLARHAFVLQALEARSAAAGGGSMSLEAARLGLDDGEMAHLRQLAGAAPLLDLNRIFRTLVACRADLDGSELSRFIVENYLCEWCLDPGLPSVDELIAAGGLAPPPTPRAVTPPARSAPPPAAMVERSATAAAPAAAPAAPAGASPRAPRPSAAAPQWPGSWRELVETWKVQKPLQARKLEEVHPQIYGPELIELVVPPESFISRALLQRDEQARIRDQFKELFGFQGVLRIVSSASPAGNPESPPVVAKAAAPALPETILAAREREGAERRQQAIAAARAAPFTRDLAAALGGRIEDVRIPGDSH